MKTKAVWFMLILIFPFFVPVSAQESFRREVREPSKEQIPGWFHPGTGGSCQFWDFSREATLSSIQAQKNARVEEASLTGRDKETRRHYFLSGDSLLCTGYENDLTRVRFSQPQLMLRFPIDYGTSFVSDFQGRGQFDGKKEVTLSGNIMTSVDGWGQLILPGGDTLQSVFRVHIFIRTLRLSAPLSREFNIDTPVDLKVDFSSREGSDIPGATWVLESIYRWYEPGAFDPVFETQETRILSPDAPPLFQRSSFRYKAERNSLAKE